MKRLHYCRSIALALAALGDSPTGATESALSTTSAPAETIAVERNWLGLEAAPIEEPLASDRPDFTESALTVPRGRAQLEMGYTLSYDREKGRRVTDQTFPEALLRVGLVDDLELRIGWVGLSFTEELFRERNDVGRTVSRNPHDRGATDLYLGFKTHLLTQGPYNPELALIPAITAPSGSTSKTSGDVDPEVKIAWEWAFSPKVGLAGNINFAVPTEEGERFFQPSASITLGVDWTDWLGSYVEYFGFYPNAIGTDAAHYVNGGLTFPITPNLQFDVRAGAGLNEEADDFFTGAGVVIRW